MTVRKFQVQPALETESILAWACGSRYIVLLPNMNLMDNKLYIKYKWV